MSQTFKIVRHYQRSYGRKVVQRGLTLAEAQAHCSSPESSSRKCTNAAGRKRTRLKGEWFDGYYPE
jgi:hypothetical protein